MSMLAMLLMGLYGFCLLWLLWGIRKLSKPQQEFSTAKYRFSILVPYRNEASQMQRLMASLLALNYPPGLYEIILIDDHSDDDSTALAQQILAAHTLSEKVHVQFLQNPDAGLAPKKQALSYGISKAHYEWIVTTDADCQVPENWLQWLNTEIGASQPKMICGPVRYRSHRPTLVEHYQLLDGISLQGVAMGGFGHGLPMLCNGANLAYEKAAFLQVNGYDGNDHIASGDDIFLMEKFKHHFPQALRFLAIPNYSVTTEAESDWSSLLRQRIRWASKTTRQNNPSVSALGSVVFLTNLFPILGAIWVLFNPLDLLFLLVFIGLKVVVDSWYIHRVSRRLEISYSFFYLEICMFLYPLVTTWVLCNSFVGSYSWKGRRYSKQSKIN